jgi:hypothetical protein
MPRKKNLKKNQNPLFFFFFSIIISIFQFGDMFMYAYMLILTVMNSVTTGIKSYPSKLTGQQDYFNLLQQSIQISRRF